MKSEAKSFSDSDSQEEKKLADQCCSKAEVLLVDDIDFNLIPLKEMVQGQFEKNCDKAENGQIAIDMYIANAEKHCCDVRYRLILTDIQMPIMDGIKAAKLIRQRQAYFVAKGINLRPIMIAIVTAYDD